MKYFDGRLEGEPKIREALKRLRGMFVPNLTSEQLRSQPQIALKVQYFVQCVVRRIIATVDGMNLGWNANNMVTAITMARSLIETVAVAHAVSQDLKDAEGKGDLVAIERVLDSAMLCSIHPTFANAAAFQPARIMKTVERFDREFLSSPKPIVKDHYEFLCEFVHPNGPGLMGLHFNVREKNETDEVSFEPSAEQREMVYPQLLFPLQLVVVGGVLLEDLLARLPEITRLSLVVSATSDDGS